ncbi:hypothetical protein BY458DRAFT_517478 [Sporodiniella umbellata]|nr:hypothetical protein BY458DRAFT_517478 [Sporodiniella umbellata]
MDTNHKLSENTDLNEKNQKDIYEFSMKFRPCSSPSRSIPVYSPNINVSQLTDSSAPEEGHPSTIPDLIKAKKQDNKHLPSTSLSSSSSTSFDSSGHEQITNSLQLKMRRNTVADDNIRSELLEKLDQEASQSYPEFSRRHSCVTSDLEQTKRLSIGKRTSLFLAKLNTHASSALPTLIHSKHTKDIVEVRPVIKLKDKGRALTLRVKRVFTFCQTKQ